MEIVILSGHGNVHDNLRDVLIDFPQYRLHYLCPISNCGKPITEGNVLKLSGQQI